MDVLKEVPTNYGHWRTEHGAVWAQQVDELRRRMGGAISKVEIPGVDRVDVPVIHVEIGRAMELLETLKKDPAFDYRFLVDYTASDEHPEAPRFCLIWNLLNLESMARVRVKARVAEGAEAPTMIPVWVGSDWAEREIFDMFGIKFKGHPDLRRILMDERWEGHPLRKDYPLRGYQIIPSPEEIHTELLT